MRALLIPILFLPFSLVPILLSGQDFVSFFTGDTSNVIISVEPAVVLAGGGSDNDDAMRWMLSRAKGGDVVVLRASGGSGYNPYFYSELGVQVNSVETIVFRNRDAAFDPYVLRRLLEAEVIFIAGGDQTVYFNYWQGTPVAAVLHRALNNMDIVIGGTSAGMMILSDVIYTPTTQSVTSSEALSDPYHPHIDSLRGYNIVQSPVLTNTITDTHFDNRNRAGRLVTFMARMAHDWSWRVRAIAANEATVICIDTLLIARIFGEFPAYQDFAYFLRATCDSPWKPQQVIKGLPLHWVTEQGRTVVVQKLAGKRDGSALFDILNWKALSNDVIIEYWQVNNGTLEKISGNDAGCHSVTAVNDLHITDESIPVFPNPSSSTLSFPHSDKVIISDISGNIITILDDCSTYDTSHLTPGRYILQMLIRDRWIARHFIIAR